MEGSLNGRYIRLKLPDGGNVVRGFSSVEVAERLLMQQCCVEPVFQSYFAVAGEKFCKQKTLLVVLWLHEQKVK